MTREELKEAMMNGQKVFVDQVFEFQDLTDMNLHGEQFSNCKFDGCKFTGTFADRCGFEYCEFNTCCLGKSSFSRCNLSSATFKFTSFPKASLTLCDLRRADFSFALMKDVYIYCCDLRGANLHPETADKNLIEIFKASFLLDMAELISRQENDARYISEYYSTEKKGGQK